MESASLEALVNSTRSLFLLVSVEAHVLFETFAVLLIIYLITKKSEGKKPYKLTLKEEEELLKEWQSDPLVPAITPEVELLNSSNVTVQSASDSSIIVDGVKVLNMSSYNFLGLATHPRVREACAATLMKYGCGSCGPRGFYGTIDTHVLLEERLASFLGTEETILYSDSVSTVASAIPAFCKQDDLIICDDACNFAVITGIKLSRSTVRFFKHNDMDDLERLLIAQANEDKRHPPKPLNRRFIIVEGLYQNHGDICPLPRVVELKQRYLWRLLLEDSMAFGALGRSGRGTAEYFDVPMSSIDVMTGSIATSLVSAGGFCAGSRAVTDHQRLSGLGYCFSASLPPFCSIAAVTALEELQGDPTMTQTLGKRANKMRDLIKESGVLSMHFSMFGDYDSPIIHLRLKKSRGSRFDDLEMITEIYNQMIESEKIMVSRCSYIPQDTNAPPASLRITVMSSHSDAELKKAAKSLSKVVEKVFKAK